MTDTKYIHTTVTYKAAALSLCTMLFQNIFPANKVPALLPFTISYKASGALPLVIMVSIPCAAANAAALWEEPFILLEKGAKTEVMEIGLGISILPELILKRVPYRIVAKESNIPAYRKTMPSKNYKNRK